MNNLPLQPLVWIETNHPNGVYFEKTNSYIKAAICFCSTLVTDYVIRHDNDTGMYVVNYGSRTENEYHTLEEAKEWCEFTHYPSKMQPYVKPSPTKVYELVFDCYDSYFTVFMTLDKQLAVDFMESVKKHDEQFTCDTSYDVYEVETIHDLYNDNHPLSPYKDEVFKSIYEDSFSEWALAYVGESFASQLSVIEHELFSTMQNLHKGE